jgi:hypothetical protein
LTVQAGVISAVIYLALGQYHGDHQRPETKTHKDKGVLQWESRLHEVSVGTPFELLYEDVSAGVSGITWSKCRFPRVQVAYPAGRWSLGRAPVNPQFELLSISISTRRRF